MSYVNPTGNRDIDGILWGVKLDDSNLTYSFPTSSAIYSGYAAINGFEAFNAQQQAEMVKIIGFVTSFCSLNITAGGNDATFHFAEADTIDYGGKDPGLHTPGFGNNSAEGNPPDPGFYNDYQFGDCWFNHTDYNAPTQGSFAFTAGLMHELGHALGLKHGHVMQNRSDNQVQFPTLPPDHDSQEYSVMTYDTYPGVEGVTNEYPSTWMQDDIAALQYLYGADYSTNNDDSTYTWDSTGAMNINGVAQANHAATQNGKIFMTIWDGGGNDTYDFSNYSTAISADFNPGGWIHLGTQLANLGDDHFARGNIATALLFQGNTASMIENVVGGSNNDNLFGTAFNNRLDGRGGANYMAGGGGNDYLTASGNSNQAFGDDGSDQLYFIGEQNLLYGNDGDDWLGVDGTGCALVGGSGNEVWIGATGDSNTLNGEGGNDSLFTNGRSNTLFGGLDTDWLGCSGQSNALYGGPGNEWMGATGNGNYLVGGDDNDTLLSIGSNVVHGENGDDWVGCSGNGNTLDGGVGNDYVAATGDNNTLDGGAGNDQLVAGGAHAGNRFVFHPGYGMDTITNFSRHGASGTDVIDLNGFGLDFTTLQQYVSFQAGGVAVITFDAATKLTFANGIPPGGLLASDFIF